MGENKTDVTHLFSADDTLIFCKPYLKNLLHLRYILLYFQVVYGLKINLNKSEMAIIGGSGVAGTYAEIFGCRKVKFPFKYSGVTLGAKYKDQSMREPVIDTYERRLAGWKRGFLSKGRRFTLIKSTLANLPIYYLSTITILVKVAKNWKASSVGFVGRWY